MTDSDASSERVTEQYDEYVMPIVSGYDPFAIARAENTTVVTAEGEAYLDLFSGISVGNAGHNHPEVVRAAKAQLEGLELVADESKTPAKDAAKHVQTRLRDEHDVVIGVGGYHKNVLRLQPPLTIGRDGLERAVDALELAIAVESE